VIFAFFLTELLSACRVHADLRAAVVQPDALVRLAVEVGEAGPAAAEDEAVAPFSFLISV